MVNPFGLAKMELVLLLQKILDGGYVPGSDGKDVAPVITLGLVDVDAIRAAAKFWGREGITKEFDRACDDLDDAVAAAQQRWKGSACEAFDKFSDELKELLRNLRDRFQHIENLLDDLAQAFDSNAYEVIGTLEAVGTLLTLLPPPVDIAGVVLDISGAIAATAQILGSLLPRFEEIDNTVEAIKAEIKKLGDVPDAGGGTWRPLTKDPYI